MNSFDTYFKGQGPVDLSTAPPSSNIKQLEHSNLSNIANTSNSQFSSSASSNFFNNIQSINQPHSNTPKSHWNSHPSSQVGLNQGPQTTTSVSNLGNTELEFYKTSVSLKDNQISQLENEIIRLQQINKSSNAIPDTSIPSNYIQVFEKLADKLAKTEEELKETKLRLDALTTAILSNPSNSITKNGRFDELETFEKILIKLKNLETENRELLKICSFGKVKQFQLDLNFKELKIEALSEENQTLKKENQTLNKENDELKKALNKK